jgi:hypothetical protein
MLASWNVLLESAPFVLLGKCATIVYVAMIFDKLQTVSREKSTLLSGDSITPPCLPLLGHLPWLGFA